MTYRDYASYLKKFFRAGKKISAVADASDGSVCPVLRALNLGAVKISILNGSPDGNFPAHGPDPEKLGTSKQVSREVLRKKADFGAIFDGDGDRVFFVDDLGRRIGPDETALFLSKGFKPPFVITPTTGWGFRKAVRPGEIKQSQVGHYSIVKKMEALKAKFAAETSGHYYFEFPFGGRRAYYDSALRAFVEFASRVSDPKKNGQKLSSWLDSLPKYFSSGELNFKVKNAGKVIAKVKKLYAGSGKVSELDGLSVEAEGFWFNLRASNTEPLLRFNAEARTKRELFLLVRSVKKLLK